MEVLAIGFLIIASVSVKAEPGKLLQQDLIFCIHAGASHAVLRDGKYIIEKLLYTVSISPSTSRVGLIAYGEKVVVLKNLNETINRELIIKSLKKLRRSLHPELGGVSFALSKSMDMFNKQKRYYFYREKDGHFRQTSYQVDKVLILIGHAKSLSFLSPYHPLLDLQFISIFVFCFQSSRNRIQVFLEREGLTFYHNIFQKADVKQAVQKAFRTVVFNGKFGICDTKKCQKYQRDECDRKCICTEGKLTNCFRVRKEFTQMSISERIRLINAYFALTTLPVLKHQFSGFTVIHKKLFCSGIHTKDYFLPWHRWYLLEYENRLRMVDCRITVPYWDWSYWSDVAWTTGLHIWGHKNYQLGSNGVSLCGTFCVKDGPFRKGLWESPSWSDPRVVSETTIEILNHTVNAYAIMDKLQKKGEKLSHCLRRQFNKGTPSPTAVKVALATENFTRFELYTRIAFHNRVHNALGGDMCTEYASHAPEFFLHHAILDKIWALWQKKSLKRKYAFFQNKITKMTHLLCNHSPANLIDNSNLPYEVKVVYSRFPTPRENSIREKDQSRKSIRAFPADKTSNCHKGLSTEEMRILDNFYKQIIQ